MRQVVAFPTEPKAGDGMQLQLPVAVCKHGNNRVDGAHRDEGLQDGLTSPVGHELQDHEGFLIAPTTDRIQHAPQLHHGASHGF